VRALAFKKKQNDGATGSRKKFDDISSLLDTIHEREYVTDKQTDRQTPDDSEDLAYA